MQENSRNKEVVENKFLIERLLNKLLDSGKISQKDISDLKWKFRKELLLHESKPPKERLEILIDLFKREYSSKENDVSQKDPSKTKQPQSSSVFHRDKEKLSTPTKESVPKTEEAPHKNEHVNKVVDEGVHQAEVGKKTSTAQSVPQGTPPQKTTNVPDTIVATIDRVLGERDEVQNSLKTKAREYLITDVEYLTDVTVNDSVIKRLVERALDRFLAEHAPVQKKPGSDFRSQETPHDTSKKTSTTSRDESDTDANTQYEDTQVADVWQRSNSQSSKKSPAEQQESQIKTNNLEESTQTPQTQEAPQASQPNLQQTQSPTSQQKSEHRQIGVNATENVAIRSAAQERSDQADQEEDNAFQVNVTSDTPDHGIEQSTHSLAEMILEQARKEDRDNPLVSHQETVEKPPRPFGPKRKEPTEEEIAAVKITEENAMQGEESQRLTPKAPTPPQQDLSQKDASPEDLASASNTKMTFDRDVQLDAGQIEQRHTVRTQQNALFDKYLNEQIETLMSAASKQGMNNKEWLNETRETVEREARELVEDSDGSISDKIHKLDIFFDKKRSEIAQHQPIENKATIEELVEDVLAKASQEVNTENDDADTRFRDTLRDTLHFKAKHLLGVDMEIPQIKAALDEEYAKHKAFYLKSVK